MPRIEWMLTLQEIERLLFLAIPGLAAIALLLLTRPSPRMAMAAMIAFLWQLLALLALHFLAQAFQWWRFLTMGATLDGLPIDIWIGWAIWWGPIAVLLRCRLKAWQVVALIAAMDLVAMPAASILDLSPSWLIGESIALAFCLFPALLATELMRRDIKRVLRAIFHWLRVWLTINSSIFRVSPPSKKPAADRPAFPSR